MPLAIALGASTLLIPFQSAALQLTFEFRGNPATSSPGVIFSADLRATNLVLPGQTIGLDLFAIVNGVDADNTNDGFLQTQGSFLSNGTDGSFSTGVGANNVAPFNGGIAQSGVLANLDTDPGLELGSLATTGTPQPFPWFIAMTDGAPVFGTAAGGGTTVFQIGKTTYTLADGPAGQGIFNYAPRIKNDGLNNQQLLHRFTLDGVSYSLRGDSAEVASLPFLIFVPEPSPALLLALLFGAVFVSRLRRAGRE